jgi:hypothetical protein
MIAHFLHFDLDLVQSVSFPPDPNHSDAEFSVCFERGGKIAKTSDRKCQPNTIAGRSVVSFDESITIAATLYKTPQGDYLVRTASSIRSFSS